MDADNNNYLQQMLEDFQQKADQAAYAERRANYLLQDNSDGGGGDMEIETELQLAMEEITQSEKDLKQILEVTTFLFEQNGELTSKFQQVQHKIDG